MTALFLPFVNNFKNMDFERCSINKDYDYDYSDLLLLSSWRVPHQIGLYKKTTSGESGVDIRGRHSHRKDWLQPPNGRQTAARRTVVVVEVVVVVADCPPATAAGGFTEITLASQQNHSVNGSVGAPL